MTTFVIALLACIASASAATIALTSSELTAYRFTDVDVDVGGPVTLDLQADRDTFVNRHGSGRQTVYGSQSALVATTPRATVDIDGTPTTVRRSQVLVSVDFQPVCNNAQVTDAELTFQVTSPTTVSTLEDLELAVVTGTWSESTTNWNNRPSASTTPAIVTVSPNATTVSFDVTSTITDANGLFDPASQAVSNGWRITEGNEVVLASRETGASTSPILALTASCP